MSKTLTKQFDTLQFSVQGGTTVYISGDGWRRVSDFVYANQQYFDLAGMSMEDKTLFFSGAAIQEVINPAISPADVGNIVIVADVMTSKPLSDTDIQLLPSLGNFFDSTLTFDQTIYFRIQLFNTDIDNAAGGYTILQSSNQLGSLEPTASDRVYITRIVQSSINNSDGLNVVYPARYMLRAEAKEEPEYEYLMRLKRSYELQQEPDRD